MKTKEWYAWINTMPPKPDDLHVIGQVTVSNPGIEALLTARESSGKPSIIELDLHLVQRPGMWPTVVTVTQVRYDQILSPISPQYTQACIFLDGTMIEQLEVEVIR
ncbi:MAG TPA: hypothetical protein VF471_14120 [Pseudoxanthomonas sp.]